MISKYKYVCLVDTPYALALYLLKMGSECWEQTRFYVGANMADEIRKRLPCVKRCSRSVVRWNSKGRQIYKLYIRARCFFENIVYIRPAELFAQDHLSYCSSQLICSHRYTLVEDGPRTYMCNKDFSFHRLLEFGNKRSKFLSWLLYGSTYRRTFGRNPQCVSRWVTQEIDAEAYEKDGAKVERISLKDLWQNSAEEWKKRVLWTLGGESAEHVLDDFGTCKTILLSQPMMDDCGLSEAEMAAVYSAAIEEYAETGIVVKPHPRDTFPFEKYFPKIKIVKTKIPMQLLCAIGARFRTAITICSSSISAFSPDTEIVWIGAAKNSKMVKLYGGQVPPSNFTNLRCLS